VQLMADVVNFEVAGRVHIHVAFLASCDVLLE